jgi:hypothetical protein
MPTESDKSNGKDGSEWVIEAIKDNNYKMVIRWSPFLRDETKFRQLGEALLLISKIQSETEHY